MTNVAEQALAAERLDRAVKLRVRGAHWDEIAEACGYSSPAAALKAVGEAMAAATQRAEETADQMRDTANLQLGSLMKEVWVMLDYEDPERDDRLTRLRAADELRRIIEARSKLNGLDKVEPENTTQLEIKIVGLNPEDLI
jgi:hypothetical protein